MFRSCLESQGRIAFIYVVDPPGLLSMAVPLLLSLRHHHPRAKIFPYCPKGKLSEVPLLIRRIHESYNAPIVELSRDLEFVVGDKGKPYRHGNKMLAAAEIRDTDFGVFLDTDTYLAQALDDPRLFQEDKVAVVPESVAGYAGRNWSIWDETYGIFGMTTPAERVEMIRTKVTHPPYFNAGFMSFPEVTPSGRRFGELWLETALAIDHSDAVENIHKRPWLDQAAMPVAIYRSGCSFEEMEIWFNYPLDTPSFLPNEKVRLYHYHSMERLDSTGHIKEIDSYLRASGLWESAEEFFLPLRTCHERRNEFLKQAFHYANERRALAKVIKATEEKTSRRTLKKEMRRLKDLDISLRQSRKAILEEHFYGKWTNPTFNTWS